MMKIDCSRQTCAGQTDGQSDSLSSCRSQKYQFIIQKQTLVTYNLLFRGKSCPDLQDQKRFSNNGDSVSLENIVSLILRMRGSPSYLEQIVLISELY